jgi:EAL and modified HD-GYP domain-containing signal transduction protein
MSTVGYELLFRDSEADRASFRDEDEATAQVIVNTFMEIGLQEMVGPHLAFINVSPKFILSDFCEAMPSDRVVLELLEPVALDFDLMKRLEQLVGKGYKIAVGDFAFNGKFDALLDMIYAVKFDVLAHDWKWIEHSISKVAPRIKRAAEKVENARQYSFCKELGVEYFQGYFFSRPEFVRSNRLPLSRLMTLRLIGRLNDPNLTINELEEAIRQDLSLSYKLLRYVGSAGCAMRGQIQSIRHAAVLTGIDRLKIWAALILFSGIEEKLRELTVTAVVRARMCEKLAEAMKMPHPDQYFLVGLFSVLDAMLSQPLPEILESLHLTAELNDALLNHTGVLGTVLECVLAYERRDWPNVHCGDLDQETIRETYVRAMAWSIRTLNGFSDAIGSDALKRENSRYIRR